MRKSGPAFRQNRMQPIAHNNSRRLGDQRTTKANRIGWPGVSGNSRYFRKFGGSGRGNRTLLAEQEASGNATIRRPLWARRLHSKRRRQPVQLFLLSRQPAIAPGMEEQRATWGFAEAFDGRRRWWSPPGGQFAGHFEGGAAAGEDRAPPAPACQGGRQSGRPARWRSGWRGFPGRPTGC